MNTIHDEQLNAIRSPVKLVNVEHVTLYEGQEAIFPKALG